MLALHCTAFGETPTLVMAEIDRPAPGDGEALVAVEAVGLGYFDAVLLSGAYQERPKLPFVPGREFCGRIISVGAGIDDALIGRRVAGIAFGGCLAEAALVRTGHFMPLSADMSADVGAAFLSAYATMLYGLQDCGRMQAGETVLVLGGSGTVGCAAIDIAKALGGRVIAAASSQEKRDYCKQRGADFVIDYTQPDWRKVLTETLGRGPDIVVDPVGGALSEAAFRSLTPKGRHLVVGFAAGDIARIPLNLPLLKRASIVGVDWGGFMQQEPAANADLLSRLGALLAGGKLHPEATNIYALSDVASVIGDLRGRASIGKPVIAMPMPV